MILTAETEPEARLKHQLDDLERMLHQLTVLDRADGPEEPGLGTGFLPQAVSWAQSPRQRSALSVR